MREDKVNILLSRDVEIIVIVTVLATRSFVVEDLELSADVTEKRWTGRG